MMWWLVMLSGWCLFGIMVIEYRYMKQKLAFERDHCREDAMYYLKERNDLRRQIDPVYYFGNPFHGAERAKADNP